MKPTRGRRTFGKRDLSREAKRNQLPDVPDVSEYRPKQRGECAQEVRPCPWVRCRYHLFMDHNLRSGSLKFPHGSDLEALFAMDSTCALDVAAEGPHGLEDTGAYLNITSERLRQEEQSALAKVAKYVEDTEGFPVGDTKYV